MKTCPKCKEMIGDSPMICPMCKYQFTEAEKTNFLNEQKEMEEQARKHFEEIRAKRAKMRLILAVIAVASIFLGFIIGGVIAKATQNITYVVIFGTAGMVVEIAVIISGIASGAFRCPYCDTILFRNYGKYCMQCGKKLY